MSEQEKTEKSGRIKQLLQDIGMTEEEIQSLCEKDRREQTEYLISRYHEGLAGKPLAALLKALKLYGEPELFADFLYEVINGPPVAAQLLVLHIANQPEWRKFEKVDTALKLYQADFEGLPEAFSYYQDRFLKGCEKRSCLHRV
ncbi:MAG: hypothetical protein R6V10_05365 [bacterium]